VDKFEARLLATAALVGSNPDISKKYLIDIISNLLKTSSLEREGKAAKL
jgi:hypothetical protein